MPGRGAQWQAPRDAADSECAERVHFAGTATARQLTSTPKAQASESESHALTWGLRARNLDLKGRSSRLPVQTPIFPERRARGLQGAPFPL